MSNVKPVIPLQLDNQDVLLKRVSGNFEKHGEESVPVLDIAWEAIVSPATMVGLLGAYCERVLFNAKGELLEPSEVFQRSDMPVPIAQDLIAQHVAFTLSDNVVREFGEEPEEGDEAAPSQLCPITNLRYEPKTGGGIWLGGTTRIRPRDAGEYWAFLEHQGRHAKLTIDDSAIKVGNGKQQSLPLPQPGEGFAAGAAARASSSAPSPDSAPAREPADEMSATPVTAGEAVGGETSAPASAARDEKFASEIGPETQRELERAKNRRGARPIDGRSGAH